MSEAEVVSVDRFDRWARLTLNRPDRRNALSIELRDAVSDALDVAAHDEDLHAVVITGAGETFSAGWDLDEFAACSEDPALMERIWASGDRFHHTLLTFPLPLLAAVNGPALGGAFDLAVCCDVRIASTTARFAHPEFPVADMLYSPLEAQVGGAIARDLLLTGRELDASTALRCGLVTEVVEPDHLTDALAGTMERIIEAPRDILVRTKAKAIARAGIAQGPSLQL